MAQSYYLMQFAITKPAPLVSTNVCVRLTTDVWECVSVSEREREIERELTMQIDAQTMLKPLKSKGAFPERNHAGHQFNIQLATEGKCNRSCITREIQGRRKSILQVNGLMATGDSKLAMDCTPAMNPCAFPCKHTDISRKTLGHSPVKVAHNLSPVQQFKLVGHIPLDCTKIFVHKQLMLTLFCYFIILLK